MSNGYKFLIIDHYYPKYLSSLYSELPQLKDLNYTAQKDLILGQCFGTADFYSKNLQALGCEAQDIIANDEILQRRWALENRVKLVPSFWEKLFDKRAVSGRPLTAPEVLLRILEAQIKHARPDVLYLQNLSYCPPEFLKQMKRYVRIVVGQIASPLPAPEYLQNFDLILTSFPHFVDRFRKMGIQSEYFKISFEPAILKKFAAPERKYACTFIGGISPSHHQGTVLLEELAGAVDLDFFGYGADTLRGNSPILPKHHGEVWGLEMFKALMSSKITINRHIDVAENYANNMRLYEATGCGALLVTDAKDNLAELFVPDQEVVTYRTVDEAVEKIKYYLVHEDERQAIAKAGQQRTLSQHTYYQRMGDLVQIIGRYLH